MPKILLILLVTLLGLTGVGTGQTTTTTPTTTTNTPTAASNTSTSANATHTITVGQGGYEFRPNMTFAKTGDYLQFWFYPSNHSVVRAEYLFPCIPFEDTGRTKKGFFSGFYPVDNVLGEPPKWTVRVNHTKPMFFYDSAPNSCIKYGMVGVINPNASMTLQKQKSLALASTQMLQPGEEFSAAASSSIASVAATATITAIAIASPSAASSVRRGLNTGSIVGIVVGAVSIALLAALFFFIGRARTLKEKITRDSATVSPTRTTSHMFSHKGSFHDRHGTFEDRNMSPSTYAAPPYPQSPEHYRGGTSSLHAGSPHSGHPGSTGFDGAWPQSQSQTMSQIVELPAESVEPRAGEGRHEMQELYAPVKHE